MHGENTRPALPSAIGAIGPLLEGARTGVVHPTLPRGHWVWMAEKGSKGAKAPRLCRARNGSGKPPPKRGCLQGDAMFATGRAFSADAPSPLVALDIATAKAPLGAPR